MSLISFLKEAGEKLLHLGKSAPAENTPEAQAASAEGIVSYIQSQNLSTDGLQVLFEATSATVTVSGETVDQVTREKIVLCCGNVQGVAHVNDELTVKVPASESKWYTVVSGDNLSKISKSFYGDPNKYPAIFEANKPMLTHPDKIYPGQVLRIPELT